VTAVGQSRPSDEVLTRMIAAHGMWKYRLREAVRTGNSDFSVGAVAADNRCPLGQWLYGEEGHRSSGQHHYEQVRSLHAQFHQLTARILELAVNQRAEEARWALESGSEFLATSARLVTLLDAWRSVASGGPTDTVAAGSLGAELETAGPAVVGLVAELVGTSLETAAQADVAAGAVATVGSSVDSVAGAVEQMTATIREIAANSSAALNTTVDAVSEAETFTTGVTRLTVAIGQIEQVLSLIRGIARQTNLLALNATIEASRAGAAGKGFAVVAAEVKELSRQTATASADVTRQIGEIQIQAGQTLDGMSRFTASIHSAQEAQVMIAAAVEEQTAATAEISRNITEAATASLEIAENVAAVALAAGNTAASSRRLIV